MRKFGKIKDYVINENVTSFKRLPELLNNIIHNIGKVDN